MTELESLLVEYTVGLATETEVIRRAEVLLESPPIDDSLDDLCELASLPAESPRHSDRAGALLERAVLAANPDFSSSSSEAEFHARSKLRELCARALRHECRPYDLYLAVQLIEDQFEFPEWLGDLWNHCDWTDPRTQWVHVPHLEEYLEQYLAS